MPSLTLERIPPRRTVCCLNALNNGDLYQYETGIYMIIGITGTGAVKAWDFVQRCQITHELNTLVVPLYGKLQYWDK